MQFYCLLLEDMKFMGNALCPFKIIINGRQIASLNNIAPAGNQLLQLLKSTDYSFFQY